MKAAHVLRLLLVAGFASALGSSPAFAGNKGDLLGGVVLGPILGALMLLPCGLAIHALILARAPRRGRGLVQISARHTIKALVLGALNTGFAFFFVTATGKSAPAVAVLGLAVWTVLVLAGSHGMSRSLGARVLGRDEPSGPPRDVCEAALGYLVLLLVCTIPVFGLFAALYFSVKASGVAALSMLATEAADPPAKEATQTPSASEPEGSRDPGAVGAPLEQERSQG